MLIASLERLRYYLAITSDDIELLVWIDSYQCAFWHRALIVFFYRTENIASGHSQLSSGDRVVRKVSFSGCSIIVLN